MEETKVYIVDEIMGRGKTSAAINFINSSDTETKFLVITPYVNEIDRYIEECETKRFVTPQEKKFPSFTKLNDIRDLIKKGRNIVSTHALFQMFDEDILHMLKELGYTLIMDEVHDVVEELEMSESDRKILLDSGRISIIEETKEVIWNDIDDEYEGQFEYVRNLCKLGSLYVYGGKILMWMFPIEAFKVFKEVYIMTYMFKAQIQAYYYDFYGLEYKFLHIIGNNYETYNFSTETDPNPPKHNYSDLITILDNERMNRWGEAETALSKTWYEKRRGSAVIKSLRDANYNFRHNITHTGFSVDNEGEEHRTYIWTTFKDFENVVRGKGCKYCFVPCTARATNKYQESTAVAYMINRYLNPVIKNFFIDRGVRVDEEGYALSEMLQFIWRSSIRVYNPITVYIPSSRMRNLLKKWISENSI